MKIGFDNNKYLTMQSAHIRERIAQFDNKLYLEFGGKLFDDYHASRVLPGFQPDSKLQMLLQLKDQAEIVVVISADEMNERGCKVLFSGRREGLQQRVLDAMDYMMDLTKDNDKGIVNFCLNYGSHAELTDAMRAIAGEVKAGTLQPEDINEKTIESHLYRDLPPVDLMIRTSGEERLSNFLLWQCAYSEFYFTPVLFPDFTKECFDKALEEYARRDRRMGGNTKK